jgi:hypothetical protein
MRFSAAKAVCANSYRESNMLMFDISSHPKNTFSSSRKWLSSLRSKCNFFSAETLIFSFFLLCCGEISGDIEFCCQSYKHFIGF